MIIDSITYHILIIRGIICFFLALIGSLKSSCIHFILFLPSQMFHTLPLFFSASPQSWWPVASFPASPGNAVGTAWCPAGESQPAWVDQWAWWPRYPPMGRDWARSPLPAKGLGSVPASCPTRPPPPLWGKRERERNGTIRIKQDDKENKPKTNLLTLKIATF